MNENISIQRLQVIPTNLQINGPEKTIVFDGDAQGEIILHYKLVSYGLHLLMMQGCIQTFNLM